MKKYHKENRAAFAGALCFAFLTSSFAVIMQFFKGSVLDFAIEGEIQATLQYGLLLIIFILGEVLFHYIYRQFNAKYIVGSTKSLKADIFESILQRSYVDFRECSEGEYIAKYTSEADAVKGRRFSLLPLLWSIIFQILLVSIGLFILDWRIALITLALLTTPLYLPKLIEKRLQAAQAAYLQAVETNLVKINDWLAGFEMIKNFSIEKKIKTKFRFSLSPLV